MKFRPAVLITIEVGSRGMLCATDLNDLRAAINAPLKEVTTLCLEVIHTNLLESFRIWCSRNSVVELLVGDLSLICTFCYVWLVNLFFVFVSHLGEPRCMRNTVVMCYELT